MDTSTKSSNSRKVASKDPPQEQAPPLPEQAPPTQAERDSESKRRNAGRAKAPAVTPGAVPSTDGPNSGKVLRATAASRSAESSTTRSAAASASRQAVERNMEDRDRLAKRRAAARDGPATTVGAVFARNEPTPTPAGAVISTSEEEVEDDDVETGKKEPPVPPPPVDDPPAAAVAAAAAMPPAAAVAVVSAIQSAPPVASVNHQEAIMTVAAVMDDAGDVEKALDDSQKEGAEVSPEAAVISSIAFDGEALEEAPVYPGADPAMADGTVGDGIEAFVADTVVDATGVAVVMSEEEEEQFEQKRRKKYLCYGAIVLVIVAVSIVVPVVILVGGGGEKLVVDPPPSIAPSSPPSPAPSEAPTTSFFDEILNFLRSLPMSPEDLGDDKSAPQYKAALWLADDDTYFKNSGKPIEDPKSLQRYALATFYFATAGDNWKLCGKNSPSCGDTPWLTDTDECKWFSLACDEQDPGVITQISFPATGNDLMGTMPAEMSLFTGLKRFLVPDNSLRGDLDVAFADLSNLETIAMPSNRLTGTVPTGILKSNNNLGLLALGSNQFNGSIPSAVSAATKLYDLQLSGNQLIGGIPTEIGALTGLVNFEVHNNKLQGPIPDELFSLSKLSTMSFKENPGINGTINPLISQLTDLSVLQLGFTGLGGPIPDEMFVLTDLSEMNLEGASFSGTVPEAFRRLNASLMDLFLNDNQFSGQVPEAFDHLTALETLQIQGNQLAGSISAAVCAERGLRFQQLATLIVDCVVSCNCCDNCED